MELHNRLIIFVAVIVVLVHIVVAQPSDDDAGPPKDSVNFVMLSGWINLNTGKLFYYMYYLVACGIYIEGFHISIRLLHSGR
jgi:glucose uptake protein GlcU